MSVTDILILLVILLGAYFGYVNGFLKQLSDTIILYVSMILSSLISKIISNLIYGFVPFLNFTGKAQGLKSINVIFYRILIYLIFVALFMVIINKLLVKFKIKEKIINKSIESGKIKTILASIVGIAFMFVFMYNVLLLAISPNFNLGFIKDSNVSNKILENMLIVSNRNNDVYESSKYAIDMVNSEDNNKESYASVNEEIITNMIENDLISEEKVDSMGTDYKLLGIKKEETKKKYTTKDNSDDYDDSDDSDTTRRTTAPDEDNYDDYDDSDSYDDSYDDSDDYDDYDYDYDYDDVDIEDDSNY